jgi:hypothetical protein
MMDPDHPEVVQALQAASVRVEALYAELHDAHPALCGSLAIAGTLVGHGLGAFVANGLTDEQIVVQVLAITAQIRDTLRKIQDAGVSG